MNINLIPRRLFAGSLFLTCLLLSARGASQEIPEQSLLPCDEAEQEALEQATDDQIKRINAYTPAEPLERKNPRYPVNAARDGKEGWVMMSYVVDAEGKVQDPVIEDFEGDKAFKRYALKAIKDWTYSPAMKNGKPTEQCHTAVRLDFYLSNTAGASRSFARKYKKARKMLDDGNFQGADELLNELKRSKSGNRYENAWMSNLDKNIAEELGDEIRELAAIKRTIFSAFVHEKEKKVFDEKYIAYLYQRMFVLETSLGYYADALSTAETIASLNNGEELIAPLQNTIYEVEALIASKEHLAIAVDLDESGNYFHTLARSNFAFADIQGELKTVEVRCDTHREKFTVAENYVWSIPSSWGNCRVMVTGEQGAKFALVEVSKI
jgi:TonB family protein